MTILLDQLSKPLVEPRFIEGETVLVCRQCGVRATENHTNSDCMVVFGQRLAALEFNQSQIIHNLTVMAGMFDNLELLYTAIRAKASTIDVEDMNTV